MDLPLKSVWKFIEENKEASKGACSHCPLRSCRLLLLKPESLDAVRVMVITEGPNRPEPIEVLVSPLNHPTFTFLYTMFSGNFRPVGHGANVYWTHVRKCFLSNGGFREGREAMRLCRNYIYHEILALKPKLIVAVGASALNAIHRVSLDERIRDKLESAFLRQRDEIYREVKVEGVKFDLAVLPHPSGRNMFWNNPPEESLAALRKVMESIKGMLQERTSTLSLKHESDS